LQVHRQRVHSD